MTQEPNDGDRRSPAGNDTSSAGDQAFGRQAARDQEIVDNLIDQGDEGHIERLGTRQGVPKPGSKA